MPTVATDNMVELSTWEPPSTKMLIFVSSTFTDTQVERDILMRKIQPLLRARAAGHGIEVTFVDMRFGVKDENTLDHMTWIACRNELERCRAVSSGEGVFFISLQAEK
jgi:hypothetical protein